MQLADSVKTKGRETYLVGVVDADGLPVRGTCPEFAKETRVAVPNVEEDDVDILERLLGKLALHEALQGARDSEKGKDPGKRGLPRQGTQR